MSLSGARTSAAHSQAESDDATFREHLQCLKHKSHQLSCSGGQLLACLLADFRTCALAHSPAELRDIGRPTPDRTHHPRPASDPDRTHHPRPASDPDRTHHPRPDPPPTTGHRHARARAGAPLSGAWSSCAEVDFFVEGDVGCAGIERTPC